jgi:hypothetical protein
LLDSTKWNAVIKQRVVVHREAGTRFVKVGKLSLGSTNVSRLVTNSLNRRHSEAEDSRREVSHKLTNVQ